MGFRNRHVRRGRRAWSVAGLSKLPAVRCRKAVARACGERRGRMRPGGVRALLRRGARCGASRPGRACAGWSPGWAGCPSVRSAPPGRRRARTLHHFQNTPRATSTTPRGSSTPPAAPGRPRPTPRAAPPSSGATELITPSVNWRRCAAVMVAMRASLKRVCSGRDEATHQRRDAGPRGSCRRGGARLDGGRPGVNCRCVSPRSGSGTAGPGTRPSASTRLGPGRGRVRGRGCRG